jgi:hypothetical protein
VEYVRNHWLWFAIGAGVVLIAMLVVILFGGSSSQEQANEGASVEQVQNVVQPSVPAVEEPVYNIPVRERFGKENMTKANVIIQAIEESYVGIEDAKGRAIFGKTLVAGDVFYVPAGNGYKAKFGNAGGVDVWVNRELAPKVGANKTSKKDVSLNPESLMKKSAK